MKRERRSAPKCLFNDRIAVESSIASRFHDIGYVCLMSKARIWSIVRVYIVSSIAWFQREPSSYCPSSESFLFLSCRQQKTTQTTHCLDWSQSYNDVRGTSL
jgi:hypothetical protein